MGSFSWIHWFIVLAFFIAPMFPIAEVLRRAGYSRWWALVYILPLLNLIGLFVFAYSRWPKMVDEVRR